MKRIVIIALACVNLALVLALVFGINQQSAKAQVRGNADYIAVTAKVSKSVDALYIIDVPNQRLVTLELDVTTHKFLAYSPMNLKRDFRLEKEKD